MEGRRYFLAIGSPECPGLGLNALPNVSRDIDRMTQFFTSDTQGYERVLFEHLPLGAPAPTIKAEVEKWFSQGRSQDDCVVIYYAGHADQYGAFKSHYLFTADSVRERITNTAIETAEIPKLLFTSEEALKPQLVLLILDTCYAGEGAAKAAAAIAAIKGTGASMYIWSSAGPNDAAGDGAFVDAFHVAVEQLSRTEAEYLSPEDLSVEVNDRFSNTRPGQTSEADVIGGGRVKHRFIRNCSSGRVSAAGLTLEDLAHWEAKGRGVDDAALPGDFFTGREAALNALRTYLVASSGDGRARVVTGKPGSGKSAVLGRMALETMNTTPGAQLKRAAVHARLVSLIQVTAAVGAQLQLPAGTVEDLLAALSTNCPPVSIFVDALDEALDPRLIEDRLLLPLAGMRSVRLIVGTRRDTLGRMPLASSAVEIDLDNPAYFRREDIENLVARRLTALRPEWVGDANLQAVARSIASQSEESFLYARVVSRWFANTAPAGAIGGGVARDTFGLPADVRDAFGKDLDRFDAPTRQCFIEMLLPLAYAQGKGLPQKRIWEQLASACSGRIYTNADLRELKERAGFYITRDADEDDAVYRLFHEAFAQYLRELTRDEDVHGTILDTLLGRVPRDQEGRPDWSQVHEPYILKYLVVHAAKAGRLKELASDSEFLLYADSQTLAAMLRDEPPGAIPATPAYLRAFAHLRSSDINQRAQYLALAAAQHNVGELWERLRPRQSCCDWFPLRAWYRDTGSHLLATVRGVRAACLIRSTEGVVQLLVVSADDLRVINLVTGEDLKVLPFAAQEVDGATRIPHPSDTVVALTSANLVRVWNVSEDKEVCRFGTGPGDRVLKVAALGDASNPRVAIGDESGSVTLQPLSPDAKTRSFDAHRAAITYLEEANIGDRRVLLTCSDSYAAGGIRETKSVRMWDADTVELVREFSGPEGSLAEWCALFTVGHRALLVAYFFPAAVFVAFDPNTGSQVAASKETTARPFGYYVDAGRATIFSGFGDAFASIHISMEPDVVIQPTASIKVEGGRWLGPLTASKGGTLVSVGNNIRTWDTQLLERRAAEAVEASVGQVHTDGEPLFLLSGAPDIPCFAGLSRFGNLRLWNTDGELIALQQVVTSLDCVHFDVVQLLSFRGQTVYVTAGRSGRIRAWDLKGTPLCELVNVRGPVPTIRAHVRGGELLAIVSSSYSKDHVEVWDLMSGRHLTEGVPFTIGGYDDKTIAFLAAVNHNGRTLMFGALGHSAYHVVTAWDLDTPVSDSERRRAYGLRPERKPLWDRRLAAKITWLSAVQDGGADVLAAGHEDGTITVLDIDTGETLYGYQAHHDSVTGIDCVISGSGRLVVSSGMEGTITAATGGHVRFAIDVGDRIKTMTATQGGRIVAGTEEGFLLFQIRQQAS